MAEQEPYPSQLRDEEWHLIRRLLPARSKLGRPPRYERRAVLDAIFYVTRSGCAWRDLPHDLPPWRLCYHYFALWHVQGLWQRINDELRNRVRERSSKKAPTAASIDSQSVKMAGQRGERGYDAGKKVLGRKRHLLVDTLGLILAVHVHSAGIQDRDGARPLLKKAWSFGWLRKIWADGGYAGALETWFADLRMGRRAKLEIVRKIRASGFHVLPRRWVVERTFAWLGRFRRLSKDYEVKTAHSEAFIYLAAARLMLRRLAR